MLSFFFFLGNLQIKNVLYLKITLMTLMRLVLRRNPLSFLLGTTKGGARLTKLMTQCQKSEVVDLRQEGSPAVSLLLCRVTMKALH